MASVTRTEALHPWYHKQLDRCMATTLSEERCLFSARYEDTEGKNIRLCKPHADMADFATQKYKREK